MTEPAHLSDDRLREEISRTAEILGELADLGMEIARAVKAKAVAADDPAPLAHAFARLSRAIRQTLMLRERVLKDLQGRARLATRRLEQEDARARLQRERQIETRKDEIEAAIERLTEDDALTTEARERLDREDYADILDISFDEAVARICRDLGIDPPIQSHLPNPPPLGEGGEEWPGSAGHEIDNCLSISATNADAQASAGEAVEGASSTSPGRWNPTPPD